MSSESRTWLGALPVPSLGTKVDNESLRKTLDLDLCVPIIVENTCVCGTNAGMHGLSCRHSGGYIPWHAAVNETICHALVWAAVLKPVSVSGDYGKRPDSMILILWRRSLPFIWDFTCLDVLSPSSLLTSFIGYSQRRMDTHT